MVTDLSPAVAFDRVQTSLYEDGTVTPLAESEYMVSASEPFARGVRVAQFENRSVGTYRVEVILRLAGAEVRRTQERFTAHGTRAVVVSFLDPELDGSVPDGGLDAGPLETVTFPPRDFVCASAGEPCATTVPLRSEAERTVQITREFEPATFTYIISLLQLPEVVGGLAAGFNLDGMDSGRGSTEPDATCEQIGQDFPSERDPGHVGVDNSLQGLIGLLESQLSPSDCPGMTTAGCFDVLIQQRLESGTDLLLIEVTGVESFAYDDAVEVAAYRASLPPGESLQRVDGVVLPMQTFLGQERLVSSARADIFDGRLRVQWTGDLPIALPLGDDGASSIQAPELRADINPDRLSSGVIGGALELEAFVARAAYLAPGMEDTLRNLLTPFADLQPSTADPQICEALSVGYRFEAVPAIRALP